jgi:hypothetical protein
MLRLHVSYSQGFQEELVVDANEMQKKQKLNFDLISYGRQQDVLLAASGRPDAFEKNRPKCSLTHTLAKLIHNFYPGKEYVVKNFAYFCMYFLGQRPLVPLLLLGPPFFQIILFGSTTLLTRMTGNSLHMQWRLTS